MRISLSLFCTTVFLTFLLPWTLAQRSETLGELRPLADLSLDHAIALALQSNPSLASREQAAFAAEARVSQAGLLPNPEFEFEAENFGGSGALSGFDSAENTATISQPILLGGKRKHRRAGAESEWALAGRDLEAVRLDVIAGTTAAFYQVLIAQQREALSTELLGLAESFAHTVQVRVDAGKVSPVEGTRAKIEVAKARARLARAVRGLEAARALLAATWGSRKLTFDRVVGEMPAPIPPPSLQQLRSYLMETPEITRLEEEVQRQQRAFDLEKSLRLPDLRVGIGRRQFEETGQSAWVAAVSLPIPIFDRNQGARKAAKFDLERSRRDAEAVQVAIDAELAAAFQRLDAAAQDATIVNQEIVPSANSAFVAVETGYREGKFGFLDVLDAQRAFFDARSLSLDSHEEYLLSRTELERLVGRTLGTRTDAALKDRYPAQGER
jgi:cobalt-zinc-cadmium efflux system outer membrane protein